MNLVARGRAILGGVCSDRYRLAPLRQWLARNWRSSGGHARRPAFSRSEGPAPWNSILTGADLLNRYFTAERGADALDGLQPNRSWPCRQHQSPRQCLKCATQTARSRLGQPDLHLACRSARTGAHPHRSGTGWCAASPGMTATVPIGGTSQPSWGGYAPEEARRVAGTLLPDMMSYDPTCPASFPSNGRTLTDDAADAFLAVLTNGKVTGDKVGPHTDLLAEFPYLGPPHHSLPSHATSRLYASLPGDGARDGPDRADK